VIEHGLSPDERTRAENGWQSQHRGQVLTNQYQRSKWMLGALLALGLFSSGSTLHALPAQPNARLWCINVDGYTICFDPCSIDPYECR
jgi:hypothetical protein